MISPRIDDILMLATSKDYKIFDNDTKNHNINIWGVRSKNNTPDSFDDFIYVFWKYNGSWTLRKFPATTDPGLYWLRNPQPTLGTGILSEGQHKKLWSIGLHQKTYKALVQVSPVTVIRDNDKDAELDFDSAVKETGMFGVNCHRANENGKSIVVDKWSAACQVLQNRQINHPDNQMIKVFEFDYFMHLCDEGCKTFGNSFTYTLVNEKDFEPKALIV